MRIPKNKVINSLYKTKNVLPPYLKGRGGGTETVKSTAFNISGYTEIHGEGALQEFKEFMLDNCSELFGYVNEILLSKKTIDIERDLIKNHENLQELLQKIKDSMSMD